jgi:hypothetical protein
MESLESESVNSFLRFLTSKQDNFGGWANSIDESSSYNISVYNPCQKLLHDSFPNLYNNYHIPITLYNNKTAQIYDTVQQYNNPNIRQHFVARFLLVLLFKPEHGGSTVLRNVGVPLPEHAEIHARRIYCS